MRSSDAEAESSLFDQKLFSKIIVQRCFLLFNKKQLMKNIHCCAVAFSPNFLSILVVLFDYIDILKFCNLLCIMFLHFTDFLLLMVGLFVLQWIFVSICFQKVALRICNKLVVYWFHTINRKRIWFLLLNFKVNLLRKNTHFLAHFFKKTVFVLGRFTFIVVKQKNVKTVYLMSPTYAVWHSRIFIPSLCPSHWFSITLELDLPCQWVRLIHCRVFSVIQ